MDAVYDNCKQILQFIRDSSYSIPYCRISDFLDLPAHFLEKEMSCRSAHFRKTVSILIYLPTNRAYTALHRTPVLFRFHSRSYLKYYLFYQKGCFHNQTPNQPTFTFQIKREEQSLIKMRFLIKSDMKQPFINVKFIIQFAQQLYIELKTQMIEVQNGEEDEIEPYFQVEAILKKKINLKGQTSYLIKWKNYPESKSTWEPTKNLTDIKDMIEQFQAKQTKITQNKIKQGILKGKVFSHSSKSKSQTKSIKEGDASNNFNPKSQKTELILDQSQNEGQIENQPDRNGRNSNFNDLAPKPVSKITKQVISIEDQNQRSRSRDLKKKKKKEETVRRVSRVYKAEDDWMAELQFTDENRRVVVIKRDIARLLYPFQLADHYHELYQQKKKQQR